jgi:hypothetical protein
MRASCDLTDLTCDVKHGHHSSMCGHRHLRFSLACATGPTATSIRPTTKCPTTEHISAISSAHFLSADPCFTSACSFSVCLVCSLAPCAGGLLGALADAAEETGTLSPFFIAQARKKAAGGSSPVGAVMERRARKAVAGVISGVKDDPLAHCALKSAVVDDMAERRMLICELFQRCGRDEFKFIVDVGLWGGALLGVAQMAAWLVYTPKWSLVAGGALVGYATDYAALKVMFEPVNPWKPRWLAAPVERVSGKEWPGFQGLFLTRQQAVSEEFAEFMAAKILSPRQIWSAILAPSAKEPCCPEQRRFETLPELAAHFLVVVYVDVLLVVYGDVLPVF